MRNSDARRPVAPIANERFYQQALLEIPLPPPPPPRRSDDDLDRGVFTIELF